jgi:pilus assembly protein CpaE
MFSAKSGADDKAAGFDAGADDYVSKPTHPAELATRVRALLNRGVAAARTTAMQPATGKGIAVLGIRGGSGVTSLAVNLSTALAASKEVVLVDLCLGSGALGMQMGHRQGDGLARLLQLGPEELDPLLVGQQLVQVAESLRLLLGSYQPLEPRSFTPAAQVQRLLELILREADLVILDLGNRGGSGLNSVLIQMDYILVVLPPQRSILTLTVSLVQHLQRVGVDLHRCGVVLMNTTGSPPSLTQRELETKTQLPVLATIPAEPEMSHRALASGRPVMLLEPNSAVADRYRELASLLLSDLFNPMSVR